MLNTHLWEYKQEQEILNLYMLETNGKYEMVCVSDVSLGTASVRSAGTTEQTVSSAGTGDV